MNLRKYCNGFIFPLLQKLAALKNILIYDFYKATKPLETKTVLLYGVSRATLSGNLEFIAKRLEKTDFKVKVVLMGDSKRKLLKLLATSKYTVVDDYAKILYTLKLRKNTKLIQVWHSCGAFKTMGFSRKGDNRTSKSSLTHKNYTDVIVSSKHVAPNFSEAFGVPIERIHPIGTPRTDVFFDDAYITDKKNQLRAKYPQLADKKLILFAPTYRGERRGGEYYPQSFIDLIKLEKELGDEYIVGLKLHPFVKGGLKINSNIIDFSAEREINDLLFITDVLVTDYSSVIFEYAFLKKPIVFYVPDLDDYTRSRGFFYDFNEYIYGPVAKNQSELLEAVRKASVYEDKLSDFYKKYLGACDGHSTERFFQKILLG